MWYIIYTFQETKFLATNIERRFEILRGILSSGRKNLHTDLLHLIGLTPLSFPDFLPQFSNSFNRHNAHFSTTFPQHRAYAWFPFFSSQTIHSTIIEYDRSSKNRPITDRKKSTPLRIYNSALKTTLSLWQTRFRRNRKLQRILFSPSNVRHTPIASAISSVHATYRFFHARNFTNVETNDRILRQSHGFFDPERRIDGDGGISRAFLGNESHFDLGSRSTTERVPDDRWRSICREGYFYRGWSRESDEIYRFVRKISLFFFLNEFELYMRMFLLCLLIRSVYFFR